MLLPNLRQDLRYAVRVLAHRKGHTLVAAATIALGVAAVTVMFSVVWGTLLQPLPWPEADRLVRVFETRQGGTIRFWPTSTNSTYLAWRAAATTVEDLAAWRPDTVTVSGGVDAERLRVATVTSSLFPLLRARPWLGRLFNSSDEAEPPANVILLSHGSWQRRFGGAADVLGRTLRLDGEPHTIVGVMPPSFGFPDTETQAWMPLHVPPAARPGVAGGTLAMINVIGRLTPGATPARAAAEGTARARTAPDPGMVTELIFGSRGAADVSVVAALDAATGEVKPALVLLLVAVGLLLVTATANVAGVQLAAATTRRREVAIRSALGAGPATITRQFLVEHALVGVMGGVCGVLLAVAIHRVLPSILPADFPRLDELRMDWRVVAAGCAAALATSLACGLMPALQARAVDVREALADDGLGSAGAGRRSRTRRARSLVTGLQVAIAAVLLVGASLLARSFVALVSVDRGYDPARAVAATIPMPHATYTAARRVELLERAIDRLTQAPGITAAGFTTILPLSGSEAMRGFSMPRRRGPGDPTVPVQAAFRIVSPGYFRALGMRVVQGRGFDGTDTFTSRRVVVVSRSFARIYLGDVPLGDTVPAGTDNRPWAVVGVVDDVRAHDGTGAKPELFVSYRQWPDGIAMQEPALVARASADPARVAAAVREVVRELDPALAIASLATLEDRLLERLARPRLYAIVLTAFAVFALAIAAVGLFGVLSYLVAQRSRELAVRSALGASPRALALLVVRQGLAAAGVGIVLGLATAASLARWVAHLLYGVSAFDAASYVMVALLLLVIAALACLVPAKRAARVEAMELLKRT